MRSIAALCTLTTLALMQVAPAEAETLPQADVEFQSNSIQYYQDYQPVAASSAPPMPTSVPASAPPVVVPTQPTMPPPNIVVPVEPVVPTRRPVAPNRPASPNDFVVIATDVQVVGVAPDLEQVVRNAIRTRPGGETSQTQLQEDVATLLQTGLFANARVGSRSNPGGLSVTYQVEPIVVRSLRLTGAQVLTPDIANTIFGDQLGATVRPAALDAAVAQINQFYTQNGYTLARVISIQPSREGVLTIEVAEGVIGSVSFRFLDDTGKDVDENGKPIQSRTNVDFLQREVQLKPGQVFREDVARKDLQQLSQLGLFDRAEITLGGDARRVEVVYNVAERRSRAVNFGGGYNDDIGIYGTVTFRDQNVAGIAQQFGLDLQVSSRDVQFNTNFNSPYRFSDPDTLGYRVEAYRRRGFSAVFDDKINLPNGQQAREGRFGGGVTFSRPVGDLQAAIGLNYARTSIRDGNGNLTPFDVQGNSLSFSGTGIDDLLTVSLGVSRDQRDNPVNPTRGSVFNFTTEQSIPIGLGRILSNRLQANYAQFVPVRWLESGDGPEVVAVNLQGGTNIGDLPPYRAFNLGGLDSVRGYESGDVGSGRSYILASTEYRFPILSSPFGGVVFADFASDLGSGSTVPGQPAVIRGKPGYGFGYGLGLRFQSPIGVIRADFGFNNRGESRLQFGFGQRF